MILCKHWQDCGIHKGGCCSAGIYDRPSYGVCLVVCEEYDGPPREAMANELVRRAGPGSKTVAVSSSTPQRRIRRGSVLVGGQPQKAYLGDRLGSLVGRVTGRQPCSGCKKIEGGLNWLDRRARQIRQRVRSA